ncbi:MAG: acyltransferase [Bacteroidetes bacterium]|nr:MAG: acyltransferase [Bacteroidota bacterium]
MNRFLTLLRYDWPLHFVLFFTNWLPDNVALIKLRGALARPFFKQAGRTLKLGRDLTFYNPSQLTIGNNVYIAKGCWFVCNNGIEIGDNVLFGPYVAVVTSNHSLKNGAYAFGEEVKKEKVVIDDGSWVGSHVTVLAGAHINKAVLVAANSVISGNTEEYGIYGGVPGKLLKIAEKK